ncbi:MAG: SCO family protein, partial [Aestuariivirga sp.]
RGKDFRLFFITVDPERDTAAMLKDYLSNFDPRIEALVPTPDELTRVAKEFRAIYEKVPGSDGEYTMNHTATVYLMNREGKLASTISYDETPENRIAKLGQLLTREWLWVSR